MLNQLTNHSLLRQDLVLVLGDLYLLYKFNQLLKQLAYKRLILAHQS